MQAKELIHCFADVVKNKYFCFEGRADRAEFWSFFLVVLIGNIVLSAADRLIGLRILSGLFSLAMILPMLGVTARRLHDTGKSGWMQLLSLIPVLGGIIVLVLCIPAGMPGANQYGGPAEGASAPDADREEQAN